MTDARSRATEIAAVLAALDDVSGIALFGSCARGSATDGSDIDLLVLVRGGSATPVLLAAELPEPLRGDDVSLSVFTAANLTTYLENWSRFALHLQSEAVVLHDSGASLLQILNRRVILSLDYEIRMQRKRLRQFEHIERFGGRMVSPLAQFYRLGRALVFINLAQQGTFDFDRNTAFAQLKEFSADLGADIDVIENLAPFYSQWRGLEVDPLTPFDPVGENAMKETVRAREAVRRLMEAAEDRVGAL